MSRHLAFSALLLGFASLLIQIVALRELLTSFLGNEISIALVLLVWLLTVAAGSAAAGHLVPSPQRAAQAVPWIEAAIAATVTPSVWIAQAAGGAGKFPGEIIGPGTMLLLSAAALLLPCLLLGALFATLCAVVEAPEQRGNVAHVYALEALGAVVAGILFHFVIAERLRSAQTAVLLAGLALTASSWVWTAQGRKFSAALAGALAFGGLVVGVLNIGGQFGLDEPGLARRRKGMRVLAEANSRYSNLAVIEEGGQVTFYAAGLPAFTTQAVQANEITIHVPLLMHPRPRTVLLISGGLGGGLGQVLQHPINRVDYVEMDRKLVDLARTYLPPDLRNHLDDPRVHVYYVDGRAFVKSSPQEYDVIVVLVPDPATTALSRFYTREFFAELKRILAPSGLICVGLSAAQAKLSGSRLYLHATVYRALKAVFPAVVVVPGEHTQYLAAMSAEAVSANADLLTRRIRGRRIRCAFVNEAWLDYAFSSFAREMIMSSLTAESVPANRDSRPISCHYWLRLWLEQIRPGAAAVLEPVGRAVRAAWLLVLLGILASILAWRHKSLPAFGAGLCIWGTGFLEMGAQLALVLAYQAVAGYLYRQIGILMSLFMLGLAAGAVLGRYAATRVGWRSVRTLGLALLGIVILQAASALCLPLLFVVGRANVVHAGVVFGVVAGWMGLLGGLNFPLAVSLAAICTGNEAGAASRLYALDLAGASAAAILIGALAIPAVGISESCVALAAVLIASVPPLIAATVRGGR